MLIKVLCYVTLFQVFSTYSKNVMIMTITGMYRVYKPYFYRTRSLFYVNDIDCNKLNKQHILTLNKSITAYTAIEFTKPLLLRLRLK